MSDISTLLDFQMRLRRAVLGGDGGEIVAAIRGDGFDPTARVSIYRNHAFTTLGDALKATFPVVCRLVDEQFFDFAAHEYLREHPPHSRCLVEYGADFADFIAAFEPCRFLPYLPDMAHFEWALHNAATIASAKPLQPQALATVPPEQAPYVALRLQPSLSYLRSSWPVDAIWRANKQDDVPPVDLSAGGAELEFRRAGDGAVWHRLDRGSFTFRTALADGHVLAAAMEAGTLADPAFDVTTGLKQVFAEGLAVGFCISSQKETQHDHVRRHVGGMSNLVIRLRQAIALLDRVPLSILQLMFRIAISGVFWSSGLTKIASWETTIALFRDEYMVPILPSATAAAISAALELTCPVFIVLGLATRLATLPLLGMTFVIQAFVYPEYWTQHLMWAAVLLTLLTKGPGIVSLDHVVDRTLRAKGIVP